MAQKRVVSSSTSTPCLPDINNAMQICFSKVGLNPDLFDSYVTKFPDAVIGENEEMAHLFCRIRPRLFECLQRTPDDCPEAEYTMASNGFDRKSMEKATNILCLDVDLYIKGLNCFRNTTVQTDSCSDRTHDQDTNQIDRQHQMPMTEETGFQKLCIKRIQNLECRLRVWRDQCKHLNSVDLKNEIECSLLPARCIREPAIQTKLRDTCAMKNFGRELRSDATSPMLTSGNIIFMIISSLVLVLGRKL
ncbi:hypothetical protein CHS0354_015467 [Potamilus streckersoni]|uniref:Uncharacterized protein n=1 Tax=Potamilus streckersoni TaxID=2493646 RepID=A0AAE0RQS8_9BIVA|nr:hypothetical protein CHS0354_015467 [Potamilus streckersoni]